MLWWRLSEIFDWYFIIILIAVKLASDYTAATERFHELRRHHSQSLFHLRWNIHSPFWTMTGARFCNPLPNARFAYFTDQCLCNRMVWYCTRNWKFPAYDAEPISNSKLNRTSADKNNRPTRYQPLRSPIDNGHLCGHCAIRLIPSGVAPGRCRRYARSARAMERAGAVAAVDTVSRYCSNLEHVSTSQAESTASTAWPVRSVGRCRFDRCPLSLRLQCNARFHYHTSTGGKCWAGTGMIDFTLSLLPPPLQIILACVLLSQYNYINNSTVISLHLYCTPITRRVNSNSGVRWLSKRCQVGAIVTPWVGLTHNTLL